MAGAIVTAPFDLVKTRLQSDTYMQEQAKLAANNSSKPVTVIQRRGVLKLLHAFVETGHILAYVDNCQLAHSKPDSSSTSAKPTASKAQPHYSKVSDPLWSA